MYAVVFTRQFKRAYKKLKKSGTFSTSVSSDVGFIVDQLKKQRALPSIYRDHALTGELAEYRECHIKGDLLLIYRLHKQEEVLELSDIGSHSQIFG